MSFRRRAKQISPKFWSWYQCSLIQNFLFFYFFLFLKVIKTSLMLMPTLTMMMYSNMHIILGFNSYFGVCKDELLYRALASSPIIDVISHDQGCEIHLGGFWKNVHLYLYVAYSQCINIARMLVLHFFYFYESVTR